MTRTTTNVWHVQYFASAGIEMYYWLDPKTVSFSNLDFGEGYSVSSATCFYLTCEPWNSYPNGTTVLPHPQNFFGSILGRDSTTGCRVYYPDRANTGSAAPYAAGTLTWSIPTQYIDDDNSRISFGSNQVHVSTFLANGDATQSKGGNSGSAKLADPSSGF
jgi:hypothetical protein